MFCTFFFLLPSSLVLLGSIVSPVVKCATVAGLSSKTLHVDIPGLPTNPFSMTFPSIVLTSTTSNAPSHNLSNSATLASFSYGDMLHVE